LSLSKLLEAPTTWLRLDGNQRFRHAGPEAAMMGAVTDHMSLMDVAGSSSLTFACGDLPADVAVLAAGHEPNGYFWEGVVQYLTGSLPSRVELDCEAGMFCARGDRVLLGRLRDELEGYLDDPDRIARLIRRAEASGFQFDD
jgi:hypothetical protein